MLLELGFGVFSAVFVFAYFGEELSWDIIFLAMLFAKIMDMDFVIYLVKNNWKVDQFAHEHRDLFHYPLLYMPFGFVFFDSLELAWLWFFASFFHFLCDTFFGGWGVKWLSPFLPWYFCMASYSPKKIIKTKKEQREIAEKYGDPNWMKNNAKFSWKLVFDWFIFLSSLVIAYFFIS